jgi:GTP-binding protein
LQSTDRRPVLKFVDYVTISVRSGKGGPGASHFRREKFAPKGGPDGGDGGAGGSVILEGDPSLYTLLDLRYRRHHYADAGEGGDGARKSGKMADDIVIRVPLGTVIRDSATEEWIGEILRDGQRLTLAQGGRGGLGNTHFKSATRQAPTYSQPGEMGEEREVTLELKLLADVGLVGFPNAGKSTLVSSVSAARPKIADYPFTTLEPNLGVLDLSAFDPADERRATIADLPGLIEGASAGAGLGHAFLRHVARTRLIAHVVDLSAADPERDYQIIRDELEAHDASLLDKVTVVIANKMDMPEAQANLARFRRTRKAQSIETVAVSAREGQHIDDLLTALARLLPDADTLGRPGEPAGVVVHRLGSAGDGFSVEREDAAFRVRGRRIELLAAQTDFENDESAERFQRDLARLGVERELVRAGVEAGDTVRIGRQELEWDDESRMARD